MASTIKQLFFCVFSIQNSRQMYKALKERYWALGTVKGRIQVFLITTMNCPISCVSLIALAKDEKPYRIQHTCLHRILNLIETFYAFHTRKLVIVFFTFIDTLMTVRKFGKLDTKNIQLHANR